MSNTADKQNQDEVKDAGPSNTTSVDRKSVVVEDADLDHKHVNIPITMSGEKAEVYRGPEAECPICIRQGSVPAAPTQAAASTDEDRKSVSLSADLAQEIYDALAANDDVDIWHKDGILQMLTGILHDALPPTESSAVSGGDDEEPVTLETVLWAAANFISCAPDRRPPEQREAVLKGLDWAIERLPDFEPSAFIRGYELAREDAVTVALKTRTECESTAWQMACARVGQIVHALVPPAQPQPSCEFCGSWVYLCRGKYRCGHECDAFVSKYGAYDAQPESVERGTGCRWCDHPEGYLPAVIEHGKWTHRGRDNDAQFCTNIHIESVENEGK